MNPSPPLLYGLSKIHTSIFYTMYQLFLFTPSSQELPRYFKIRRLNQSRLILHRKTLLLKPLSSHRSPEDPDSNSQIHFRFIVCDDRSYLYSFNPYYCTRNQHHGKNQNPYSSVNEPLNLLQILLNSLMPANLKVKFPPFPTVFRWE